MRVLEYPYDHDLLAGTRADGRARLRVASFPETAVVLGRSGDVERDLRRDALAADRVPLYRRVGGGCPVVLDPGNLVVSLTLPAVGFGRIGEYNDRLTAWLLAGLEEVGLEGLARAGTTDLVLGDRKVSGSCTYRSKELLYFSATLLVDADLSLLGRYLAHPPREPKYRRGRSHADFVRNLPLALTPERLASTLREHAGALTAAPLVLANPEISRSPVWFLEQAVV